jgi:hypothetical protein
MNEPSPSAGSAGSNAAVTRSVLTRRVRFKPDVMIQQVGGESVLLDLQSEQYFGLDPVGTRMMTLINEADTVAVALDQLVEEYEVERAALEADAIALIAECVAQGLLAIEGS